MSLAQTLGRTIADFCANKFTDPAENHCAHFVCHVLGLGAGYDCKTHTGRDGLGAGLRVHELFDICPQVGAFDSTTLAPCIVFVTDKGNVDLGTRRMRNVPQKHVGLYDGVSIYHYSNVQDIVVGQSPKEFLKRFQAAYAGTPTLYFGSLPPGSKQFGAAAGTETIAESGGIARPAVTIREVPGQRTDYYGRVEQQAEFYIGRSVAYADYKGLYQPQSSLNGPRFDPRDFIERYGTAAALVGVISAGESGGYFNRVNTYDRAAFTFGFFQLAAHTPNDNLILLFRRLATTHAGFKAHFPDLTLREGRLHRLIAPGTAVSLEREYPRPGKPSDLNLKDFMAYLNPDGANVDKAELETAARLVALANADLDFNRVQVNVAVEITMGKLRRSYDGWYDLNGQPDVICAAIADIHHQGRGTKTQVRTALASGQPSQKVSALCRIGEGQYASRCAALRKALKSATAAGLLGQSVFDRASGVFRPSQGWLV